MGRAHDGAEEHAAPHAVGRLPDQYRQDARARHDQRRDRAEDAGPVPAGERRPDQRPDA